MAARSEARRCHASATVRPVAESPRIPDDQRAGTMWSPPGELSPSSRAKTARRPAVPILRRILGQHGDPGATAGRRAGSRRSRPGRPVLQAELVQGADRPDRHEVLRGEQGGRRSGSAIRRRDAPRRPRPRTGGSSLCRARRRRPAAIIASANPGVARARWRWRVRRRGGRSADGPASIRCWVACDRGLVVVGQHGVGDQADRWPVDEDHRRALLALGLQVAVVGGDRGQDQPVDPAPGEGVDQRALAFWVVVRSWPRRPPCRVARRPSRPPG